MRALLVALTLAAAVAVAGCSEGPLASEDCIVLAMGGNKLCGEDAAAWCSSTDSIRETSRDLNNELGDYSQDEELAEAQSTCDSLKADYGY